MVHQEHLKSTPDEEEYVVKDPGQKNGPECHIYLTAAVRRQQELASLNERLARFLRFAHDVDPGCYKQRSSNPANRDSLSQKEDHSLSGTEHLIEGTTTTDPFRYAGIEELGAAIEEKTQSFRSSLELYDTRIANLRRAMISLSEKNEELMLTNAELRFSSAESSSELQQLKNENEKLKNRVRHAESVDRKVSITTDHNFQQNLINSLQQENRRLRTRLNRHKQTLRNGLDDFISRSMEALQNGTPMQTSFERILVHDSDDETATMSDVDRFSARWDSAMRGKIAQLEEHLQSVTDELEHEKFKSQRKMNLKEDISNHLKENLSRKENELLLTSEELEVALGALQSLIQAGDETQRELDVYRRLLDRGESRLYLRSDDNSAGSSSESEVSLRSRKDSGYADRTSTLDSKSGPEDASVTETSRYLEIEKHDVRRGKFVVLANKGVEPLDISRWYLVQQCGKNKVTHRFPSPFIIKSRSKVIVWSADVKASHQSPMNYVMAKTVLPWCDSGEGDVDLVTKVYDRLGYQISKRETRIHLSKPVATATRKVLQSSKSFVDKLFYFWS